jgi:hypothetical protein
MILVFHGAAGGWDELLIALVAFGVMWFAVKLAGRKPAGDSDEAVPGEALPEQALEEPAHPPAAPRV